MEDNVKGKRKQEGRVFGGIILIGAGAALLLRNSGFPLPYWLFSWPVILILVGIYSGIKHNFTNKGWLVLIALGTFVLLDDVVPDLTLAPYFWPIAIIGFVILFIVRPEKNKLLNPDTEKKNPDMNATSNAWKEAPGTNYSTETAETIRLSSVFSSTQRNIVSKNFQGGKVTCVFGGADVDLTQADIEGRVEVKFEIAFGGAKIIVPPHWTVHNEIEGVFHGVEDERKYNSSIGVNPGKVLVLKGSVVFGGVDIRSY